MAVSDDRKYSKEFVYRLLEGVKGKTLGEVDLSHQFDRTLKSPKITGIAGDVIEQSVFGYERDRKQECDIEIDGVLTELKTTGVRIPRSKLKSVKNKTGEEYNMYLSAKEGISVTGVTLHPTIQTIFETSHFWEKLEHLLIVFYEYKSYDVVPAAKYADFPIVDYCYNTFSESEQLQLRSDWEIVRDYLQPFYEKYPQTEERDSHLEGFTHALRSQLLLIDLAPGFKHSILPNGKTSYQHPRYRLKKTFVDYIVKGHFDKSRSISEIQLGESFGSFRQLDERCHSLSLKYRGFTLAQFKEKFDISSDLSTKDFTSKCVLMMFDVNCKRLNQISDFIKAGIIAKTITITANGLRTEDMKLKHIDFGEWSDRDVNFEDSEVYSYFCEHSFLCPIFCEHDKNDASKTTFEGFKRFAFDDDFIEKEVRKTWEDSRRLIHENELEWEYSYDSCGNKKMNSSGSYMGAPNFPKGSQYTVFFRGGSNNSSEEAKTECVNGIYMLPQFFWLKGLYIVNKLNKINYL